MNDHIRGLHGGKDCAVVVDLRPRLTSKGCDELEVKDSTPVAVPLLDLPFRPDWKDRR